MGSTSSKSSAGTAWRIWDLHVHTPASLVQGYGGNTDDSWERFLSDLENLPDDIKVIGINDYWFLDGYRRVVRAREEGRLKNLDAVFPVVEMRLDQFGGTLGNLSRVNLHVIFDPELDPDLIQAQFLNALQPSLKLSPSFEELGWQGVIARDSLISLGSRIKASVPVGELAKYDSDLQEGFNNLNVSLADVQAALSRTFFQGKALIAVGKTEWADIKWTDQSIAAKKNVINSAHLIFTAYEDASRWSDDVERLRSSKVTHRLLDCSDAHHFSDSDQKMRLGAYQTWINTTPTLAGLAYALEEFDRRVYVGLEPPTLARIRRNPERFISSIEVASETHDSRLFDHDLLLNPGFVAIVGNKGQGKSALLDCIALAGNSSRNGEFAFLTPSRFLSPSNSKLAKQYHVEVEWATGTRRRVELSAHHDRSVPVSVEYLPQAFVERVCNTDPNSGDADEFERELRTVLFTHIPDEDRVGQRTFDALLSQKTKASQGVVDRLRENLRPLVEAYVALAAFREEHNLEEANGRLKLKEAELAAAQASLQQEVDELALIDSASRGDDELASLKQRSDEIEDSRVRLRAEQSVNEQRQASARQALLDMASVAQRAAALRVEADAVNEQAESTMGPAGSTFVSLTTNEGIYDNWRADKEATLALLKTEHAAKVAQLQANEDDRLLNAEALAAADGARERARQRVIQSKERVAALEGDESESDSLNGLVSLVSRIKQAPTEMDRLREEILEHVGRIHEALLAQLAAVQSLYLPASEFISQAEAVKNAGLQFSAELRMLPSWRSVPNSLDGRRIGDFSDWLANLHERIEDTSWGQLGPQLREALLRLERERGDLQGPFRNPKSALRSSTTLDDFLVAMLDLSWLEVRFGLTGDGLPLAQLSPGQRGLVLALFYLVVDRRTTPLLLDQPEENLDNETIASKLVPAIHEAAGRRQTIVVTHNANLAVVGDADQIVHCQLIDQQFRVSSGSIAEMTVAQFAMNVLEGTKTAFQNRRVKYEAFPDLV